MNAAIMLSIFSNQQVENNRPCYAAISTKVNERKIYWLVHSTAKHNLRVKRFYNKVPVVV